MLSEKTTEGCCLLSCSTGDKEQSSWKCGLGCNISCTLHLHLLFCTVLYCTQCRRLLYYMLKLGLEQCIHWRSEQTRQEYHMDWTGWPSSPSSFYFKPFFFPSFLMLLIFLRLKKKNFFNCTVSFLTSFLKFFILLCHWKSQEVHPRFLVFPGSNTIKSVKRVMITLLNWWQQ